MGLQVLAEHSYSTMSKKGFSVGSKGSKQVSKQVSASSDVGEVDLDPDVQIKKVSRESGAQQQGQSRKGSSGSSAGYTFTGITPGSKQPCFIGLVSAKEGLVGSLDYSYITS